MPILNCIAKNIFVEVFKVKRLESKIFPERKVFVVFFEFFFERVLLNMI